MVILLIAVCLLTGIISFLCSLTEAVLLTLNPLSLQLQSTRGVKHATQWLALKQHIERPISAILVFNTLANTGPATLAGALFVATFGSHWLWAFTLLISTFVIFGGELAPKIIGVHHADRVAPRLIGPLTWVLRLTQVPQLRTRFMLAFEAGRPAAPDFRHYISADAGIATGAVGDGTAAGSTRFREGSSRSRRATVRTVSSAVVAPHFTRRTTAMFLMVPISATSFRAQVPRPLPLIHC